MDDTFTLERLDRTFANNEWLTSFGSTHAQVIRNSISDHTLILSCISVNGVESHYRRKLWRYEACWNLDGSCKGVIMNSWNHGEPQSDSLEDLKLSISFEGLEKR